MARRFTRSRGRSGAPRETEWASIAVIEATLGGSPTAVLAASLNAAALLLRPFTVVRTRGIMHVISDQAASTETYGVAMGLAVVSDQASAVGVTAVPTPITDRDSDLFFVYEEIISRFEFKTGVGFEASTGTLMAWDSKAMRRVNGDQDIVLTVENEINGAIINVAGRMLLKLH